MDTNTEITEHPQTYRLPKRFLQDHAKRGCLRGEYDEELGFKGIIKPSAVIVREIKSHYYVKLTVDQAQELLSDANYYRDGGGGGMDFFEFGAIISSARATYAALIKAGVVAGWE